MSLFTKLFDCLRDCFWGNPPQRDRDEQDTFYQYPVRNGHYSEPSPTTGSSGRAASLPRRFPCHRIQRRFKHPVDRIYHGGARRSPRVLSRSMARGTLIRHELSPRHSLNTDSGTARQNSAIGTAGSISRTGTAYSGTSHSSLNSSTQGEPASRPTLSLARRDMDVIDALFYTPGASHVPQIEWDDLVRVMRHIGFRASPGNTGNYRFSVARSDDIFPAGSRGEVITAHRPHGRRPRLGLSRMREIGDRMNRAFGWTADTFTCK
ncbi:hypothetical protein GQX73_g1755 [Xylaria multiplex]|uniref:Uncharacterized protein n=1 Tax=Xylaria multiplex TaxID=323545 RepID=A0A7C8J6C4_9PEZI|nr:hypothetical protein GQX73_g1755 [Xylaria multiplex]